MLRHDGMNAPSKGEGGGGVWTAPEGKSNMETRKNVDLRTACNAG